MLFGREVKVMSRIEVSEIDTRRKGFATDVREIIDLFCGQEFTAKHVIAVILMEHKHDSRKIENIRRTVRWVISQDIERGLLVAVRQGKAGDHTPGKYKRKEKKS